MKTYNNPYSIKAHFIGQVEDSNKVSIPKGTCSLLKIKPGDKLWIRIEKEFKE